MDALDSPTTTGAAPLTDVALCRWIGQAAAGEAIIYHIGLLARDRAPQTQVLPPELCRELSAVADRALRLAEAGVVHLLQRRLGEERFAYLLVVRPRPRRSRHAFPPVLLAEAA